MDPAYDDHMDFGYDYDRSPSSSSSVTTEVYHAEESSDAFEDISDYSTVEANDSQQTGSQSSRQSSPLPNDAFRIEEPMAEPQPSTSGAQALVSPSESDKKLCPPSVVDAHQDSEPMPKKAKKLNTTQSSDDDDQSCPICFELWDNSGLHRLVSLKCGHLFGQSCIEKWLKGNGQRCPQCNLKARKADIRIVYAKTLKVRDTTERDRTQQELEKERAARLRLEIDLLQTKAKYTKAQTELDNLKEQLKKETQNRSKTANQSQRGYTQSISNLQKLILEKTLVVCKDGNCRVMAFLDYMNMVVVSHPNNNPLFPQFGLKKLNTLDFSLHEFVGIHEKQIRDVCFGGDLNGLVLTAAMDKTVKLTSVMSNTVVQSYPTDATAWSCVWNKLNSFQFFAGLQNGTILLYDTRQTSGYMAKLPSTGLACPVVSLQHAEASPSSALSCSGLLAGQLNKCSFFEMFMPDDYKLHYLPVEGSITSISLESSSRHFMVSTRPDQRHLNTRHLVYELSQNSHDGNITCNHIETFHGGGTQRLLGKSRLLCNPTNEGSVLACGADESSNAAIMWDVGTGKHVQKLQANSPILDICPIKCQNKNYICTLTEKSLQVYKWQ